jgi:hypothetical protein
MKQTKTSRPNLAEFIYLKLSAKIYLTLKTDEYLLQYNFLSQCAELFEQDFEIG